MSGMAPRSLALCASWRQIFYKGLVWARSRSTIYRLCSQDEVGLFVLTLLTHFITIASLYYYDTDNRLTEWPRALHKGSASNPAWLHLVFWSLWYALGVRCTQDLLPHPGWESPKAAFLFQLTDPVGSMPPLFNKLPHQTQPPDLQTLFSGLEKNNIELRPSVFININIKIIFN